MTRRRFQTLAVGAVLILVALVALSACGGKYTEQFKDAPRSGNSNTTPADTIQMPDGFSNLATKCDHGNRVYVAFHQNSAFAAVGVVPADPTCHGVG